MFKFLVVLMVLTCLNQMTTGMKKEDDDEFDFFVGFS